MNEIKEKTPILDKNGSPLNPGYSFKMNYIYNRELVKAREERTKEWDFYQFIKNDWVLQMTIGHSSLFSSFSTTLFNLKTGERYNESRLELYKKGKIVYDKNPEEDHTLVAQKKNFLMKYKLENGIRDLKVKAKSKKYGNVSIDVKAENDYDNDKMVILTPFFESDKMFYLNYKENYYKADIDITFGQFKLSLSNAKGLMDWGRGYWPYKQEWYWGNATFNIQGHDAGYNIGWGFGNLKNATENMFFYDHKGYKLGVLDVENNPDKPMSKVVVKDPEDRFYLKMTPIYDNYSQTKILYIDTYCHQVYYNVTGYFRLDDKTKISFTDVTAFLEHAVNKW